MKNKRGVVVSVAVGLLMASGSLFAHHSEAVYDKDRLVTIKGTITEHAFINPHTVFRMAVKDANGNVKQWTVVGSAVSAERAAGWTKDSLKPGDEVTVTGMPYRDGQPYMARLRVVKADGKMLPISGFLHVILAGYLQKHGKELSPEDYEMYKKSLDKERLTRQANSGAQRPRLGGR